MLTLEALKRTPDSIVRGLLWRRHTMTKPVDSHESRETFKGDDELAGVICGGRDDDQERMIQRTPDKGQQSRKGNPVAFHATGFASRSATPL